MTISVKHKFASQKPDGADATVVRPSNWNDEHALTMNGQSILGRVETGTGAPSEIPISSLVSGMYRNRFINPNGDVNQRGYQSGASATAANQYILDRWRIVVSGQNVTWTTAADGTRTFTAPAGGVEQVIEAVNLEAGTYVLNWAGTATATVAGNAVTKGTPFAVAGNANVVVRFSGGTFSMPQLERGTIVTAPERRPIGIELGLCQRYYEAVQSFLVSDISAGSAMGTRSFFKMAKRATPTITVLSAAGAGNGSMNARTYSGDVDGINVFATPASGGPARGWADTIGASAEL